MAESERRISLEEAAKDIIEMAGKTKPSMSLYVSDRGKTVTLVIDTSRAYYSESGHGIVGGDCGLLRDFETNEVIGIELRVIHKELSVFHEGPLKINEGFLKDEFQSSDQ